MSNPQSFLARWSRRKRVAAETEEAKASAMTSVASSPAASEAAVRSARPAAGGCADDDHAILPSITPDTAELPFDPLSVPPIESITADTDIRGFLAPGVPPELTRAALRRAWAADPKIRDFVGLADYDWDFNAPGSMAGFGSLDMTDELRQVVARIVGPAPTEVRTAEICDPASATPSDEASVATLAQARAQNAPAGKPADDGNRDDLGRPDRASDPAQCQSHDSGRSRLIVPQRHGGALPK